MPLIQLGKSWQDKDGFLTPVTVGTLTGAFGEERVLTLDYIFDQSLNDCEIYFNPALFVEQGITLDQTQSLPPSTAYWFKVTTATVAGVENTMNLLNSNATERNMSVAFELNTDRMSFKIRLTCFLTADILTFLNDDGIDNSIRLLGNTKNAEELENLEDSVYNLNVAKGIGVHVGVKVPAYSSLCKTKVTAGQNGVQEDTYIAEGEIFAIKVKPYSAIDKFEIFLNGVLTASSGTQADNNYGVISGFDGSGYPLGAHPDPPVVPSPNYWYIGGNLVSPFDKRTDAFTVDTGLAASIGDFQQIVWVKCQIGDTIVVRVAGTSGTIWDYEIFCPNPTANTPATYEYVDAWISANFIFLNEGLMTNPVFDLSRNAVIETEFATFADTDVKLQIDYSSPNTISNAKIWVIDADNTVQSLDFKKAYGYQPNNFFTATVPTNVGGDTWETQFVIDKTKLNIAGRYFIIAVYYDTTNQYVASYISDAIFVTDVQFLTPTITGTIYNLVADFQSNYIEVSPLQRVCCEITLNKYTGFDAAFEGGNVKIGGETFTFIGKTNQGSFENTNRFVFSDSSGSLIIRFYLRVKEDWQNTEVDVLWNINFNVEYTTIAFPQRISVSQMEQNKAIPNLTEIKLYRDGVDLLEDGDTACDANFLRVETIKDASALNYAQAAIWKDDAGNVYEEEAWSPISVFTQSSNAFQSNVEIYFGDAGSVNNVIHDITNNVDNGEVGMVGYPPPIPLNFIRHPFQNTIFTGRNTVFYAEHDSGTGKSFASINGIPSSDFLFRIGGLTTSRDANSVDWAAFSDLSFAAFAATPILAGQRIMVRYVGASTQVNIVGYIEMPISATPVNPKILNILLEKDTAAGDLMLFTGLNTNFTGVSYLTGAANSFSNKRTFAELAANQDLMSYNTGLANANSPNNTFVPHIYFKKNGNTTITANITVNQIESVNVELGNPSLPLSNVKYPAIGTGALVVARQFDRVNDLTQATSAAFVAFMNIFTMSVGERRTVVFRNNYKTTNNYQLESFQIGRSAALGMFVGHGCSWGTTGNQYAVFEDSINSSFGVITTVFTIERPPSLTNGNPHNYIKKYTNAKLETSLTGALANLSVNPMSNNNFGNNFLASRGPHAMEFIAFFNRHLTKEEIEICSFAPKNETFSLNPQYAWDYGQTVNTDEIPHVGILAAPNIKMFGGPLITDLYY